MVRHVVMFKFKPEVDNETKVNFLRMLNQLAQDVEVVRALDVGTNITSSSRACDLVLTVDVDNEKDLDVYGDHPLHQPVKQKAGELCAGIYVVDYVIPT